jgi:hypothetical protein
MLKIGKDLKKNNLIQIDDTHSRAILICGKRGSGKSYTLGVIAEELFSSKEKPFILIVDPIGIYWTMCLSNASNHKGLPIKIIVPGNPVFCYGKEIILKMQELGIEFQKVSLNPADLSAEAWCNLFDFSINEPLGISLYRSVQRLRKAKSFNIHNLIAYIQKDVLSQDKTKEALINRLKMAIDWGIFSAGPQDTAGLFTNEQINVLDFSVIDPGAYGLRNLILSVLCQDFFKKQAILRRKEELNITSSCKRIWLLIDEAQQFCPQGKGTLAKEILIRWIKEGRQPGLSCVFASQQPSSLDNEIISQCDIIVIHKITTTDDILAVNKLSQDYMASEMKIYIRYLKNPGEAVMVDDEKERVLILKVRKRITKHGGEEVKVR